MHVAAAMTSCLLPADTPFLTHPFGGLLFHPRLSLLPLAYQAGPVCPIVLGVGPMLPFRSGNAAAKHCFLYSLMYESTPCQTGVYSLSLQTLTSFLQDKVAERPTFWKDRYLITWVIANVPGGYLTGQAWLVMHHERYNVLGEGLVPFSPDAPVREPSCPQPGQQGVICHPGYELEALEQGVLGYVICQWWIVQNVAISICMHGLYRGMHESRCSWKNACCKSSQ